MGPGIGVLLDHWQHQRDYKLKMFGIGTEFRRLKRPSPWLTLLALRIQARMVSRDR